MRTFAAMLVLIAVAIAAGSDAAEKTNPLDCGGYTQITSQPVPPTHRRSPETCGAWRAAMAILEAAKPVTKDGGK